MKLVDTAGRVDVYEPLSKHYTIKSRQQIAGALISTTEQALFEAPVSFGAIRAPEVRAPRTKSRSDDSNGLHPSADLFPHAESIDAGLRIVSPGRNTADENSRDSASGKFWVSRAIPCGIVPVASFADLRPVHKIPL